ncbi:hypothetical protein [Halostreptopolyspora alba]
MTATAAPLPLPTPRRAAGTPVSPESVLSGDTGGLPPDAHGPVRSF